jgi:hypothetical protein
MLMLILVLILGFPMNLGNIQHSTFNIQHRTTGEWLMAGVET